MSNEAASILLKDGLSPSSYFNAVDSVLSEDWITWEPETVWAEIEDEIGINPNDMSPITRNKLMAYRMALNSSAPWEDWHVFLNVALVFSGVVPNTDSAQVASPSQIAWAISMLTEMHPDWEFSDSVKGIAAVMLYNDGVCWVPGLIGDLVNDNLFNLQKHYEGLGEFVKGLAENYVSYMGQEAVSGEGAADIHTVRIKAMERYVKTQQLLEKAVSYV